MVNAKTSKFALISLASLGIICSLIYAIHCHVMREQRVSDRQWAAMAFALATLPSDVRLPLPFYIRCDSTAAGKLITISNSGVVNDDGGDNTNKLFQTIDLRGDVVLITESTWRGQLDAGARVASPLEIDAICAAFLWNEMCGANGYDCNVDILEKRERSLSVALYDHPRTLNRPVIYGVGIGNGRFVAP